MPVRKILVSARVQGSDFPRQENNLCSLGLCCQGFAESRKSTAQVTARVSYLRRTKEKEGYISPEQELDSVSDDQQGGGGESFYHPRGKAGRSEAGATTESPS